MPFSKRRRTISPKPTVTSAQRIGKPIGPVATNGGLTTTSGQVTLKMPKLKGMRFATAIVERCKRREASVEEAMIEMYLAGVSARRIEGVSEILWGSSVSAATASNPNERVFEAVEKWRSRPLTCKPPYVFVDGIYLKRAWIGSFENVAAMVAIGVNDDGYREAIGMVEGFRSCPQCWCKSRFT